MKKHSLLSFAALISGIASILLFSYAFPPWKVTLYGVSMALLCASAGVFGALIAKKKKALKAVITGAVFLAADFAVTFLINNVLFKEKRSTDAALIITALLTVAFTVLYVLSRVKNGKKLFPAVLSVILIGAVGFAPLYTDALIKLMPGAAEPAGLSVYSGKEMKKVTNADFYVSPDGNDKNDGTAEKPFATLERARDEVRKTYKTNKKSITVAVKAGEYRVSSVVFDKTDGGTKSCPVIYRAYGDGEVVLNGGITIDPADFKQVTDEAMLSRLSDTAKQNVLCADLKKYGLTADDWGKIYAIGSYNTAAKYDGDYVGGIYCELFVNDKRQSLARYPDAGFLYTEKVISTGKGRESDGALTAVENWDEIRNPESDVYEISPSLAERMASWKTLDDVWMFGFFKYDWADASSPVGEFDPEKRTLSPKFVSTYGTKTDAPYYFFNVFEELDAPGEWYLERENGIIYVYPEGDISACSVDMSVTDKPIINVDGADYLTFDGFTIKGTRGDAVTVKGNSVTVENCLIKNVAGNALYMEGYDCLAYANEITRTGKGGISLSGGDRETLKAGNNKADNNYIHDWSEIYQTYQPAVSLYGVGNICSHNEMVNSPHEAITYGGNNHIIEYNNIHDVCLLTDDAGAIYAGRRWDYYGNIIRYNAVYNLGSLGHTPDGIYMDDALSGQTIYGNILVNVPKIGIHLGGGRDMTVKNNIIINTNEKSISYDSRAIEGVFGGWFTHSSQKDGDMWQNLFASPWQNDIWKKAFPQMQRFSDNFDDTDNPDFVPNPAYSDVSGNIIMNIKGDIGGISDAANKHSSIENNLVLSRIKANSVFTNPSVGDYTLKADSAAFDAIPDFEPIPYNEIGRY
ncbi:MAG: right-handed parallel beta-helix repeat-containing protein [Clostridia bacterium]|nr:right-handed parallel beta-helix repeat-containing protein [Clostridia bacterium]